MRELKKLPRKARQVRLVRAYWKIQDLHPRGERVKWFREACNYLGYSLQGGYSVVRRYCA